MEFPHCVKPTLTELEVTVPPPEAGADAVTLNVTGSVSDGVRVPIWKAWPVQLPVVLVIPPTVWLLGSVNVQVAVALMSCDPALVDAVACRQKGVPLLTDTLWVAGLTVIEVMLLNTWKVVDPTTA